MDKEKVRAAKLAFSHAFQGSSWLKGVGIGDVNGALGIRVMVATEEDLSKVPTSFAGVPVIAVVVGSIIAY